MNISKYRELFFNYTLHYPYYLKTKWNLERDHLNTKEEIGAYQIQKIKEVLIHANQHVPYYQELFRSIGFQPEGFGSLEDLKKIPFLTKQIVRERQKELTAINFPQKYIKNVQTGGTTGMPMEFLLDKRYSSLNEMAYLSHMWKQLGYKKGDRCIVLREDKVENIVEGEIYWKRNLLTNWLIMSAFHLNADTFEIFYQQILRYKPRFILAFPSNAVLLANFLKQYSLDPIPSLKGIICSSENLYDWQREYLSSVFHARVFSFYGHSEKCILAQECSDMKGFEFYPQYGYVELINDKGLPCSTENERGEIVATGFHHFVVPFIRYKTEDVGVFTTEEGCIHPNWFKIKELDGRLQDYLVDRDLVQKTYMHIDRPFWNFRDKVLAYQYIQNEPGKVLLNIQPKEPLSVTELSEIREIFLKTYFKFELEIQIVDHIPRTKSGKFRYLVQNFKPSNGPLTQRLNQYEPDRQIDSKIAS